MLVPRVSQIVVIDTATIAVFGWMSHCGPTIPMSESTKFSSPRLGLNSSNQMIEPTDAEIAMVLDIIVLLAGLQGVPEEIYEAAHLDGAHGARLFTRITVPMVSPSLFFLLVVDTIAVLQAFTQIHLLTRGGPVDATRALVYSIYLDAFQNFQFGYASAQAVILFVLVLALTVIQFQVVERRVHYQ